MKTLSQLFKKIGTITISTIALTSVASGALPPPPPPRPPAPPATNPLPPQPQPQPVADNSVVTTSSVGTINRNNPFFQALGNGRSCESCHQASQGWSVTPAALQARFTASNGTDPIFRLIDGANSPNERTATLAQRQVAYSLLLRYGVLRVGIAMPSVADFTLQTIEDPYGYASGQELSLYRRPLPSTNLKFLSTVMWDARETLISANSSNCIKNINPAQCFADIPSDLLHQSNSAIKGHAQFAAGLSNAQLQAIVTFESQLTTAKANDSTAGSLSANGARGGTTALAATPYYFGINDVVSGDYRTGTPFNRNVFTIYNAWAPPSPGAPSPAGLTPAQAAIGRGQMLFNTRPFIIAGVSGFNDALNQPAVRGTCSSCHSTPNVGSASVPRLMNTGTSAVQLRTPDLPLYTFRNTANGAVIQTTDPGLALQTGKWRDMGKFKVPSLRGLAAHAPYFHGGHEPDLQAVVGFYNRRFNIGMTPQETADMVAFLRAL